MAIRQVSENLFIDLRKVSALRKLDSSTIVYIEGSEFEVDIEFEILLEMINNEKQEPIPTTNPSQFAG